MVGRPAKIVIENFIAACLVHKREIITQDKSVVSRNAPIWNTLREELNLNVQPSTLYTKVTSNLDGVLDLLRDSCGQNEETFMVDFESIASEINSSVDCSTANLLSDNSDVEFKTTLTREEFQKITKISHYKQSKGKGRTTIRSWTTFIPYTWQNVIQQHIYNEMLKLDEKINCALHFRKHHLTKNAVSGSIEGYTRCGRRLNGIISSNGIDNITIYWTITIKNNAGLCKQKCKKNYIRKPEREKIFKDLKQEHVEIYRARKANEMISQNEFEPPFLPTSNVLHVIKSSQRSLTYFDSDPIKAIAIMKHGKYTNSIHSIWLDPFCVHYWTNSQVHLYQKCYRTGIKKVSIDATGGVCNTIQSKHVFLYQIVINCVKQFSISQMLSTSHRTDDIQYWLQMWIRSGVPCPNEIVVDSSRALLNAISRTFTRYENIGDYADALSRNKLPACYIRIDVAHFINSYSKLFGKSRRGRLEKVFWLAVIGQLIICQNEEEAKDILRSLYIVASSATTGLLQNNKPTSCEEHKDKLDRLIKENSLAFVNLEEETRKLDEINCDDSVEAENLEIEDIEFPDEDNFQLELSGTWYEYGRVLKNEMAVLALKDKGRSINALQSSRLIKKVTDDLKLFPIWGNVYRNKFGYGRVPATSASSEGEFNKTKTILMRKCKERVDKFLEIHLDYISGKCKIDCLHITDRNKEILTANDEGTQINYDNVLPSVSAINLDVELLSATVNNPILQRNNAGNCVACTLGDSPSGAHLCISCDIPVHAIEPCSYPHGEEGYGQKRVCGTCCESGTAKIVLSTKPVENWRGLGEKVNPSGLYLGNRKKEISSALAWTKRQDLPILKNGNNVGLKSVTIGKKSISLSNTCAFDSLFQVLLAAAFDNESLKLQLSAKSDCIPFFQLVLDVLETGIVNVATYQKRATILMEICNTNLVLHKVGLYSLDCARVVGWMAGKLFTKCPTLLEYSTCNLGCKPIKKVLTTKQMDVKLLLKSNAQELMANECLTVAGNQNKCWVTKCLGFENIKVDETGPVFIIDISNSIDANKKLAVSELPQNMQNPINREKLMPLVGLVAFSYSRFSSRFVDLAHEDHDIDAAVNIGHYTGWVKRGDQWFEYDDNKVKKKAHKYTAKMVPHLLIYLNV